MELLQSRAPAERELLGNSAVRTLDIRIWSLDFWTLNTRDIDIGYLSWDIGLLILVLGHR